MILEEETLNKLRLNSPPGGWFPALQGLSWCITEFNLPYADLCFVEFERFYVSHYGNSFLFRLHDSDS